MTKGKSRRKQTVREESARVGGQPPAGPQDWHLSFLQHFQGIAFQGRMDYTPLFFLGAVEAITGYSEQEFLAGNPRWDQVVHPEDLDRLRELGVPLRTVPGYAVEREYRILRRDGEVRWVREDIRAVAETSDRPAFVQGAIYDITARKELEQALVRSEERYRVLFQDATDAIWVHGMRPDGRPDRFIEVNDTACRLLGYTREELLQLGPDDIDVPELASDMPEVVGELLKSGYALFRRAHRAKDGRTIPVEIHSHRLELDRLPIVLSIARDISDRLAAEKALRESENRFRAVVEAMEDVVFLMDRDQRYLGMWGRWMEKHSLSPELYLGKTSWEIFGEERKEFFDTMNRRVLAGETYSYEEWFDLPFGKVYYHTTLTPVRDASGLVVGIAGLGRDITGRKIAEEALERARAELERQNVELSKLDELKDAIIRDVSHELKTPVAKQAMQIEILKARLESLGVLREAHEMISGVEASIRRQDDVIRNILTLSRLQAGERQYRHEPLQLDRLLADIVRDGRPTFENLGVVVEERLEPLTIESDGEMLWHVFSNLVNNAVKYRTREAAPRIEIALRRAGGETLVTVADNGLGISDEEQRKVFNPFYQSSSSSEGIGVGLTIARMIVEGLGGRIALRSAGRGLGTTAEVVLPMGSK